MVKSPKGSARDRAWIAPSAGALGMVSWVALSACTSIANVDLSYVDAGDAASSETSTGVGGDGGGGPPDATRFPEQDGGTVISVGCQGVDGSACDLTQGLGCCLPGAGAAPFCVDPVSAKSECGGGVFIGCEKGDPTSDSQCCWNGSGAGASTAYAAACGARPLACHTDIDCPIGTPCNIVACRGLSVGGCGVTPACP